AADRPRRLDPSIRRRRGTTRGTGTPGSTARRSSPSPSPFAITLVATATRTSIPPWVPARCGDGCTSVNRVPPWHMARLLIVHHTPSPTMHTLFESVRSGATNDDIEGVDVTVRPALTASVVDVLEADGYVLGTPANLGYMSGA